MTTRPIYFQRVETLNIPIYRLAFAIYALLSGREAAGGLLATPPLPFAALFRALRAIVSWTCCWTRTLRSFGPAPVSDLRAGRAGRARLESPRPELRKSSSIVGETSFFLAASAAFVSLRWLLLPRFEGRRGRGYRCGVRCLCSHFLL